MSKYESRGGSSKLLENTGYFILVLGLIVGGLMVLSAVTNPSDSFQFIGTGAGVILVSIVVFAFAKVQVSINDNIEALKNYKKAEYKEAHQVEEGEHFDPFKD